MLTLITRFFGGRALKAVVGGVVTTGMSAAFTDGFSSALTPLAADLGVYAGGLVVAGVSFVMGYLPVYAVPNSKEK